MKALEDVTALAALGTGLAALLAGALVLAVTRRPLPALAVLLELLLAAGLLRLAGDPSWQVILSAAAIVALRRLLGTALPSGACDRSLRRGGAGGGRLRRLADRARASVSEHLVRPAWRS